MGILFVFFQGKKNNTFPFHNKYNKKKKKRKKINKGYTIMKVGKKTIVDTLLFKICTPAKVFL